ncbi:MAG TPA: lactate utilization protein [Candidatus Paceibacterota bacterium]|nr:lactate utilization protein [Candidatus Paceibacterota bacterium]
MDFTTLATPDTIERTMNALAERGFQPVAVSSKEEALARIKELVPAGASVMNGASETLREIGYLDFLKEGSHPWRNLHDAIIAEADPAAQARLRRESVVSDCYVGSVHALTEGGEMLIASNSGSQLPHLAFTSPSVVLVVGSNKVVPTLQDAFARIAEHIVPLEDARMRSVYGYGTDWSKSLILHKENPAMGRSVHVIIVRDERLGF